MNKILDLYLVSIEVSTINPSKHSGQSFLSRVYKRFLKKLLSGGKNKNKNMKEELSEDNTACWKGLFQYENN